MVKSNKEKLTKERWLSDALEILASEGTAGLSLNKLVERFHVTKGSFYWHFESLAAFQEALVNYWHQTDTASVPEVIERTSSDPAKKLRNLLCYLIENKLDRYESVMASLVLQKPDLRPKLEATYRFRQRYVRKLFTEMGYSGREATARTRIVLAYGTAEFQINMNKSKKQRLAQIDEDLKFLIGRD